MREGRASRRRGLTPRAAIAGAAAACVAGAIVLAMAPAQAEASSSNVTLTLTGMVDSSCDLGTGGTTAYIAPGGTVTLKASLAGLSVLGIPITSSKVASFRDTVVINGRSRTLTRSTDKIVLSNIRATTSVKWRATALVLHGLLGDTTVPLSGANAHLPAGGELSWSGRIIPKSHSNCGIAIAVPTVKASAGPVHVTVPGAAVTVPNPIPKITSKLGSITKKVPLPHLPGASGTGPGKGGSKGGKSTPSIPVKYTPPPLSVPEKVMPHAVNFGGAGGFAAPAPGSGGGVQYVGGVAPPLAGGGGGASAPGHGAAATPDTTPAKKTVDLSSRDQLGGQQLPVVLAIAAILALVAVTGWYAKLYLLRRN